VKSNIGHAQAAAGAASIIKMVLALRHELLPRTLHADEPTPHVDWSAGTVRLLTEERHWPSAGRPRRGAVSSFGFSGTNAHVILESPPARLRGDEAGSPPQGVPRAPAGEAPPAGILPWVVSGRGDAALRGQAERLAAFVRAGSGGASVIDTGWSLASGRSVFQDRAVVLAADGAGFTAGLEAVAAGQPAAGVITGQVPDGGPGKVAFVFGGQGSQRTGMGRDLAAAFPVFADAVAEACGYLDPLLGQPVSRIVLAGAGHAAAGAVDQTVYTQAGLFALQVGLARLLASWGITPDYVTGHSIGEIAAAHVAGVLTLSDACVLVVARGQLMQQLGGGGAMAAVAATEAEVSAALAQAGSGAVVAAVNGPASVVVSGSAAAVAAAGRYWREHGRRVRRLRTSHAFHSALVEPMLERLARVAAGLSYQPPRIPVVCGLTGRPDPDLIVTADYWVRQAREPVRFADCVRWLTGGVRRAGRGRYVVLSRPRYPRRPRRGRARRGVGAGAAGRAARAGRSADGGGRDVRVRGPGGLGGHVQRFRREARGPADVRLPAPAVLARRGAARRGYASGPVAVPGDLAAGGRARRRRRASRTVAAGDPGEPGRRDHHGMRACAGRRGRAGGRAARGGGGPGPAGAGQPAQRGGSRRWRGVAARTGRGGLRWVSRGHGRGRRDAAARAGTG
jgi:malonyl CoA-acyl carrier protein transacylase